MIWNFVICKQTVKKYNKYNMHNQYFDISFIYFKIKNLI